MIKSDVQLDAKGLACPMPIVKTKKEIPTVEDINAKYDFDVEYSENYKDGKFELKDGGIVYADFNFYLGGKTFDSLSAKFYEDKLVQAQVEKKDGFTVEEVLWSWCGREGFCLRY